MANITLEKGDIDLPFTGNYEKTYSKTEYLIKRRFGQRGDRLACGE